MKEKLTLAKIGLAGIIIVLATAIYFLLPSNENSNACLSVFNNTYVEEDKHTKIYGEFRASVKAGNAVIDVVAKLNDNGKNYNVERTIILKLSSRLGGRHPVTSLVSETRHHNDNYSDNLSAMLFGTGEDEMRPIVLKNTDDDTVLIGNSFSPVYMCMK
ncbi:hypothetical protein WCE10_10435 [Cronobacter muytjensii]|uniref:hypothetical protein n=1 Tax=Cronobacter muytjensii TaxID=413501 RepID=UPI0034D72978